MTPPSRLQLCLDFYDRASRLGRASRRQHRSMWQWLAASTAAHLLTTRGSRPYVSVRIRGGIHLQHPPSPADVVLAKSCAPVGWTVGGTHEASTGDPDGPSPLSHVSLVSLSLRSFGFAHRPSPRSTSRGAAILVKGLPEPSPQLSRRYRRLVSWGFRASRADGCPWASRRVAQVLAFARRSVESVESRGLLRQLRGVQCHHVTRHRDLHHPAASTCTLYGSSTDTDTVSVDTLRGL